MDSDAAHLSAEDAKLVTLARATRARARADEGAAVRDLDGRTYAAASVRLAHLDLSALDVCVAMAVSSGSAGLEAAVVLADGEPALDAGEVAYGVEGGYAVRQHDSGLETGRAGRHGHRHAHVER